MKAESKSSPAAKAGSPVGKQPDDAPATTSPAQAAPSGPNAAKKALLIEALSYIGRFRGKILVIKYGGAAQEHQPVKETFAHDVVLLQSLGMLPVVVHGGGPGVSRAMKAMGQEAVFVDGLRVTTKEGLAVTEMVLSGSINKEIVALLTAQGGRAVGISGKDGPTVLARKHHDAKGVDLGYVGEIEHVDPTLVRLLLEQGFIPVISPIGIGRDGTTYNINADSTASRIAGALKAEKMIFMTDVDGVLKDGQLVSALTKIEALDLIDRGVISGGMVPKVEAMLHCLNAGVGSATIINGGEHHAIIAELFTDKGVGTQIRA
ncbi:MAG TPA: acetylglutamate kinase [bacterium]|nr:acetylglutamate kinase [bacterium]